MNKVLISVVALSICVSAQNEIKFKSGVQNKLEAGTKVEKIIVPVNLDRTRNTQENMRKWVGNFIDLRKIQLQESKTFNRSYCKVSSSIDPVMLLTNTPKNPGQNTFMKSGVTQSVPMFYHEGPSYFSFSKEKDTKATKKLPLQDAADMVKNFVVDNDFIQQTKLDRIGMVETFETRNDQDGGNTDPSSDILVKQDIVFHRYYSGLPVFNSKVRVSFNPDNLELLELTKFNWNTLDDNGARKISPLKGGNDDLIGKMKSQIAKNVPAANTVEINDVQDGWFQSDNELIPVVYFKYSSSTKGDPEARTSTDLVSLTGDNSVFMKDFRNKNRNEYHPTR
jgi:hypothetical protein